MAFDLALSEHNDLIFAANRDLLGVGGVELVEQRVKLRIKMERGSWVYDTNQDLGSNVHRALGKVYDLAASEIPTWVRQALEPMEDIQVHEVQLRQPSGDSQLAEIVVSYAILTAPGETTDVGDAESDVSELALQIPVEG